MGSRRHLLTTETSGARRGGRWSLLSLRLAAPTLAPPHQRTSTPPPPASTQQLVYINHRTPLYQLSPLPPRRHVAVLPVLPLPPSCFLPLLPTFASTTGAMGPRGNGSSPGFADFSILCRVCRHGNLPVSVFAWVWSCRVCSWQRERCRFSARIRCTTGTLVRVPLARTCS